MHFFYFSIVLLVYFPSVIPQNITAETEDAIVEIFNKCNCVEYYLCDADNYITKDIVSLVDIRSLKVKRILCSGTKFCCKERTPGLEVTTSTYEASTVKKKLTKTCGVQLPTFNVRVLSDNEGESSVLNGEFPWIASIFEQSKTEARQYEFKCSGSLIHPQVVLTANHCIQRANPAQLKVVVNGKNVLKVFPSESTDDERNISQIVKHPQYYSGGLHNNLALLLLDQSYDTKLKTPLNTICLPPQNHTFENTKCLVAGWGKGSHKDIRELKKVQLPLVEHQRCQDQLRKTRLGAFFDLHESFRCAGGEAGKDACRGDGGSPLMCQINDSYYQAGIVAWGIGCGTANVPGVYTDVTKFHDWIFEELGKFNLNF